VAVSPKTIRRPAAVFQGKHLDKALLLNINIERSILRIIINITAEIFLDGSQNTRNRLRFTSRFWLRRYCIGRAR
jgi:hypothetical protein